MGRYALDSKAGTITFPEGAQLVITSPDMEFFLSLINKLLTKNHIRIGDSLFHVNEVRFDEQLVGEVLTVRTLSPVIVYSTLLRPEGGKYTCYYQPGEGEFEKLVTANLAIKYEAFHGRRPPEGEVRVRPLDRPRLHVTSYKGTKDLEDGLGDPYLVVIKNTRKSTPPKNKARSQGTLYEIYCETTSRMILFIVGRLFENGNLYIITSYWADDNQVKLYYQESEELRDE